VVSSPVSYSQVLKFESRNTEELFWLIHGFPQSLRFKSNRWRQYVSPKCWCGITQLYSGAFLAFEETPVWGGTPFDTARAYCVQCSAQILFGAHDSSISCSSSRLVAAFSPCNKPSTFPNIRKPCGGINSAELRYCELPFRFIYFT
jgi:hypothetical protein